MARLLGRVDFPDPPMTGPEPSASPAGSWLNWALAASLAVVGLVFAASLEEEPYHIDELRQTRSYEAPVGFVVESAFAQDQPPLDPVLNSLLQRLIGRGDWQQRLLSAASGLGGVGVLAALLRRRGVAIGAPISVLILGLSPLIVGVFVYARPYGLPFFLTTLFLYLADIWLTEARSSAAVAMFPITLLLPLSRTLEPNIVLGATVLTLTVLAATGRARRFRGSVWVPVAASLLGLLAVGLPVLLRLGPQLTGYTEGSLVPSLEQTSRLVTDLPVALTQAVPGWPVALLLIGWALSRPGVRGWVTATWWWWVLLLVPVCFILLFLLTTDPDQPLFDRYLFTWVPLIAMLVGVAIDDARDIDPVSFGLSVVAALVLLGWTVVSLTGDLRTNERGDWKALSETILATTDPATLILLEEPVPIGSYRTPFAGRPRYLPSEWSTPRVMDLVGDPDLVGDDQEVVFAWSRFHIDLPVWMRTDVDDFFSLYAPMGQGGGKEHTAEALVSFSDHLDPDRGATLTLAAASIYHHLGDDGAACDLLSRVAGPADLARRATALLESFDSPLLDLACASSLGGPAPMG